MKSPLKTTLFKVFLIGLILVSGFQAKPQLGGASNSLNVVLILSDDMDNSDLPKLGYSEFRPQIQLKPWVSSRFLK